MQAKNILVVGSLNMDQVVRVPHIPHMGETLLAENSLKFVPGGKGANQAVAIARMGASVTMAGRVGIDSFGDRLLDAMRTEGIDTQLIVRDKEENTGTAFIFLSHEGDNAIVVAGGTNMLVGEDEAHMQQIHAALASAQALVLQLEIPLATVTSLIEKADTLGVPVTLNLAPAQALSRDLLRKVTVLVLNETEATQLSGQQVHSVEDARIVATILHGYGIQTVVITLGARGAMLVTRDATGQSRCIYQASPKVQPVDTTAAGDCFVGALTVALIEGQRAEDALRFAVYAASLKIARFGAQSGIPYREEVLASYHSGH
jgi:ribokinase